MINFLNKKNSVKYKEDLLEYFQQNIDGFIEEVELHSSKSKLDFSPESLINVWDYVSLNIELVDSLDKDTIPVWAKVRLLLYPTGITFGSKIYSNKALYLLGLTAYYFSLVLIKNNSQYEIDWIIWNEKNSIDRFQPVLVSKKNDTFFINPLGLIIVCAIEVWSPEVKLENSSKALLNLYFIYVKYLTTSVKNIYKSWSLIKDDTETFYFVIDEEFEHNIGGGKFSSLDNILRKIDGVEKVEQQDREVFIIASQLSKELLESKIDTALADFFPKKN